MKPTELALLLPCHSLEDFPVHHEGEEAEGLLAAWSGLWHPTLIAACGQTPAWYRADAPPENLAGRVIVVPQVSDSLLLPGWPTRAKAEGAILLRKHTKRETLITAALELLDNDPPLPQIPAELVADFLALGTGFLLVELLTRQMRYMSNLDETRLQNAVVEAAKAAVENREDDARQHLKNAFETLYEGRERFYPVDNFLIDLTLTAETTLGASLRRELNGDTPLNLLLSGELLDRVAAKEPESLAALRHAIDRRTADVVGGEYNDGDRTLESPEATLRSLVRGRAAYDRHLGQAPKVFARRRQGLTPLSATAAARFGFAGALGFTLDDGRIPTYDQAKVRWEGFDSSAVDCLMRVPVDAASPQTFLELPRRIGESMDRDYVATTVFAHWPGAVSPYFDDLRRISSYVPVLGKFVTLTDYFDHTERPGQIAKFEADRYQTTSLRTAVVRSAIDPISTIGDGLRRRLKAESAATLHTLADVVRLKPATDASPNALLEQIDDAAPTAGDDQSAATLDRQVDDALAAAGRRLSTTAAGADPASGLLLWNTHTGARRELVDVSDLPTLPAVAGPVVAVQENESQRWALVDIPGLGFSWLQPGPAATKPKRPPKPIVDGNVLRADGLELHIHERTGGIKGLFVYGVRGNRISQQLAFRLPSPRQKTGDVWRDPDREPVYSTMVCESVEPSIVGPLVGEITSRGMLLDPDGKKLAGFTQRFRAVKGLPLLTIDVELDVIEQPRADAWGSYYAMRFAWDDETADLGRGVFLQHNPTKSKRPESPYFVEIENATGNTLILTGGLPYHLSTGFRMLDTLLASRGERRRNFRVGIALDSLHPAADALAFLEPPVQVADARRPVSGPTGWLFFIDAKNLVATHWESLREGDRVVGFRVRLLETEGLSGRVELQTIRKIRSARQIDGLGGTLVDLPAGDDRLSLDVAAYEWIELEAKF